MAKAKKEVKIKCVRSDQGGEFTSEEIILFCDKSGIMKQLIVPYTPQQNGIVERKNRTVMSLVRSKLKEKIFLCSNGEKQLAHVYMC